MSNIESIRAWNKILDKDFDKLYQETKKEDLTNISEYGENIRRDAESALNEILPEDEISKKYREILENHKLVGHACSMGDVPTIIKLVNNLHQKMLVFLDMLNHKNKMSIIGNREHQDTYDNRMYS